VVVEWSSPNVGNGVDFPFDWDCFHRCHTICHFQVLWTGGPFCGGRRYDETDDLRREIRDLKDEIAKLRKKE
jgi:hypothetical protein